MRLSDSPIISEMQIQARVRQLAEDIGGEYAGQDVYALLVLKGAAFFAADLLKHLRCNVSVDFIRVQSYSGSHPGAQVEFLYWPEVNLSGRNVLLIEDILDTGHTCAAIMEKLAVLHPAKVSLCTLLDKRHRRTHPINADYIGFTIDDRFVVGYGMDYNEAYRNLPDIYALLEDGEPV